MKVLCIGDSITKGSTGVDWVKLLAGKYPYIQFVNAGVNGHTLKCVKTRLRHLLQRTRGWDTIVLQAGMNDVLLPLFAKRNTLFRQAYAHLLRKGYAPEHDAVSFGLAYEELIGIANTYSLAKVICCTLSVVGESGMPAIVQKRNDFNDQIRRLTQKYACDLADVGTLFDQYLQEKITRDYLVPHFISTSFLDEWRCRFLQQAETLSRSRGLWLTIDGIHLNTAGAGIYATAIAQQCRFRSI